MLPRRATQEAAIVLISASFYWKIATKVQGTVEA